MEKINKIYTDPSNPGSFSSVEALIKAVKEEHPEITRKQVLDFIERNRTATLFKQTRKRFPRSKTIPTSYLSDVQVDLGYFYCFNNFKNILR